MLRNCGEEKIEGRRQIKRKRGVGTLNRQGRGGGEMAKWGSLSFFPKSISLSASPMFCRFSLAVAHHSRPAASTKKGLEP